MLVGIGEDGSIIQYQFKNKQILCRAYAGNKWESWKYLQENFIVSEFGNSETDAISQKFFTEKVQNIADNISNSNTTVRFDRIVTNASIVIEGITQSEGGEVVFVASKKKFAYLLNDRYYENWPSVRNYMSVDNKIFPDKVYLCGNKAYIYYGGTLLASDEEAIGMSALAYANAQKALDKLYGVFTVQAAMIDELDELNNPVNTTTYYTVYYQYHPVGVLRLFGNAKSNIVTQILDANWDIDANGNLLQGFVGTQIKSLVRVYNAGSDELNNEIPKQTWGKWKYYSEGGSISIGNTYDDAVKNGYKGTSEDFYKNLSNIDVLHFFRTIPYSNIDSTVNSGYYIITDNDTYSSDILLVSRYGEDDAVVQMLLSFQFSDAKWQKRTLTADKWSSWEVVGGDAEVFTENLTVKLNSGKSFGRYVNGDIIPCKGKTVMDVIKMSVDEPEGLKFSSFLMDILPLEQEVGAVISGNKEIRFYMNDQSLARANSLSIIDITANKVLASGLPVESPLTVDIGTVTSSSGGKRQWKATVIEDSTGKTIDSPVYTVTWKNEIIFFDEVDSAPVTNTVILAGHRVAATTKEFQISAENKVGNYIAFPATMTLKTIENASFSGDWWYNAQTGDDFYDIKQTTVINGIDYNVWCMVRPLPMGVKANVVFN